MKRRKLFGAAFCLLLGVSLLSAPLLSAQETIVAVRHAEKPAGGLGQLTCRGLNRALALPRVLISRFGKPDAIYAPDPADRVDEGNNHWYSYVRPLVTIEPTAIALGMPVNTQIGYTDTRKLQSELTAPANAYALVFVAWEHGMLNQFAQQMLRSYGENPSAVPVWPDNDYGRIYIFRIERDHGQPKLTFSIEREQLSHSLSDTCPGPAR